MVFDVREAAIDRRGLGQELLFDLRVQPLLLLLEVVGLELLLGHAVSVVKKTPLRTHHLRSPVGAGRHHSSVRARLARAGLPRLGREGLI